MRFSERLLGSRLRSEGELFELEAAIAVQERITVCQPGKGQRVVWILVYCLLEVLDSFL